MIRRTVVLALFCAAFLSAHARANEDSVQFFTNIHVDADQQVHDAVCFFCNVEAEGKVTGDVVVLFGNIDIAGADQHDVVSIFGNVTGDDDAAIDNDLVSIFGSVRLGDHVHVGRDLVAIFGSLQTGEGVTVGRDRVVQPGVVLFGPFFLLVIVFIVVIREFRCARRRQFLRGYGYPPHP